MDVPKFLRVVRDGQEPNLGELETFVLGISDGSIPKYQAAAFLMAVYCKGLSDPATVRLTELMRDSGSVIQHPGSGPYVDKHSTGGVGDKISIPLAPIVAACGAKVPMIAGRGLGHTGGTLDKLESIPGFSVGLSPTEFIAAVEEEGLAIIGQTADIAPADKVFYALRDVTGTIESIPLITASILSKKLAEGIDALTMDVKVGRAAFMKDLEQARALADSIVAVGKGAGIKVSALLTRMEEPLGRTIGNSLEIQESVEIVKGEGPEDTTELTYALASEMLAHAGIGGDEGARRNLIEQVVREGSAARKLEAMIQRQGGDPAVVSNPQRLEAAPRTWTLESDAGGRVSEVDAYGLAVCAMELGAGRKKVEDKVDPRVGLEVLVRRGASVAKGQPLLRVHDDPNRRDGHQLEGALRACLKLGDEGAPAPTLVIERRD